MYFGHYQGDGMAQFAIVKWFKPEKGFGFLTPEDGSKDVFVHFSAIQMDGYKTLNEGERVEFEAQNSSKGPAATMVRKAD